MYSIIELLPNGELGEEVATSDKLHALELELDLLTKENPGKQYGIFDEQGLSC